ARLERLHRRSALVDLRRDGHPGDGRELREALQLVRQRVGLLQSHDRPRPARREQALAMEAALAGIKSIRDLPIENKRLFLRVDFNVPMEDGKVTDDTRIREALPTIKHAIERNARVILASHLGRPKKGADPKYSLVPAGERL